jgi:hypothetical protein
MSPHACALASTRGYAIACRLLASPRLEAAEVLRPRTGQRRKMPTGATRIGAESNCIECNASLLQRKRVVRSARVHECPPAAARGRSYGSPIGTRKISRSYPQGARRPAGNNKDDKTTNVASLHLLPRFKAG